MGGGSVPQACPRRMGIEVLPATGRWDDFASFMVPRKPGGRRCVCIAYRKFQPWHARPHRAHARAVRERTGPRRPGVRRWRGRRLVLGRAKSTYRALVNSRTIPHIQDEDARSVVCFVVRPGFRSRGLMRQLLDGAVAHAGAMGATALEGYPVDPGSERIDQTSGYVGTVQLFEADRFRRVRQTAGLARRQAPLARPPRASLTSPAPCSPADLPSPGSTKDTAVVTAPSATRMNDLRAAVGPAVSPIRRQYSLCAGTTR